QADALSALLSKKVTTELLVLVRAESLPTDHPAHDVDFTSDRSTRDVAPTTGHPTPDADSTPAASTAASGTSATPAAGAPPSPSTSGRADTDTAAADTVDPDPANADTAGSSDTRPGTPQAGDGSTRRAGGPRHIGGTGSAESGAASTSTGSAGAGAGSTGTGSTGPGTGSMDTGSAGAGAGSEGSGAGSEGSGSRLVREACRTCGHAPDRLAPGLLIATGQLLPISDIHRLARTSRLVRMVVDAKGRVLDVGRAVRLATPAQRQAILARYTTCYRDDCTIPADMCEIDHVTGWAEGGSTDLDQLAPACAWHNRDKAAHPDRYRLRRNHDGTWTLLHLGKRGRFAGRFRR
ncbi:HNH endonuclease signature motif containing protein, partial [Acrocarpospora pleiomorpha]